MKEMSSEDAVRMQIDPLEHYSGEKRKRTPSHGKIPILQHDDITHVVLSGKILVNVNY